MSIIISCDWGTSSLRLRLAETGTESCLDEIKTAEGIGGIHHLWQQQKDADRMQFYCEVLGRHIAGWENEYGDSIKNIPLLVSGMASSSIGFTEIPYTLFPFRADGSELPVTHIPPTSQFTHDLYVVSGACTGNDVMRGEETLLAGIGAVYDGLFVFPGTHSKHIVVENGMAVDLKTYMTGEFFELLTKHSVLAGSLQQDGHDYPDFFAKGVTEGSHQNLLHSAFGIRVNQLLKKAGPAENHAYLSGLLIGAELKDLVPGHYPVTVVAENNLMEKYLKGLTILQPYRQVFAIEAGRALLNGHFKIFSRLNHA